MHISNNYLNQYIYYNYLNIFNSFLYFNHHHSTHLSIDSHFLQTVYIHHHILHLFEYLYIFYILIYIFYNYYYYLNSKTLYTHYIYLSFHTYYTLHCILYNFGYLIPCYHDIHLDSYSLMIYPFYFLHYKYYLDHCLYMICTFFSTCDICYHKENKNLYMRYTYLNLHRICIRSYISHSLLYQLHYYHDIYYHNYNHFKLPIYYYHHILQVMFQRSKFYI